MRYIILLFLSACQAEVLERDELESLFENQWWETDQELVQEFYDIDSRTCFIFDEEKDAKQVDGHLYAFFVEDGYGTFVSPYLISDDSFEITEYDVELKISDTEEGYEGIASLGIFQKKFDIYPCSI